MHLLGRADILSESQADPDWGKCVLRAGRLSIPTERPCQGPRLGLFVQKTDQQRSWQTSRTQLPSPFQAPCPHHPSSRLLFWFCRRCICLAVLGRGSRVCQVTLSEGHCSASAHFLHIPALPASFQYVSIDLLHPQTLHMITDAQDFGAGEGLVRDAAAGSKEGIVKKMENKYQKINQASGGLSDCR